MPLYEYECRECGSRVEVIHDVDEDRPEHCPKCGGELKRLLGVPGLIFKGSGFYVNDYGRRSTVGEKTKGSKGRTESTAEKEASETVKGTIDEPQMSRESTAQKRAQPEREHRR